MIMKKAFYTFTIVVSAALVACGRPSTSNLFALDGIGDPNQTVPGNPVPGKWGGTIDLGNWNLLPPSYSSSVFNTVLPILTLDQAYFNNKDIGGLGGWDLLVLGIPAPLRLENGQTSTCYMDPATLPLLGGELVAADVGEDVEFDIGTEGLNISRDSDEDVAADDLLLYYNILETTIPYDTDVDMSWDGGTLDGFDRAPPLPEQEVLHFPEPIRGLVGSTSSLPTINNVPMSSGLVASDNDYHIEWESWSGQTPDLLGTQIIFTVYGPVNFGDAANFDVAGDNPFFTKFAQIVCLVDDNAGEFHVYESVIDPTETDPHAPFTLEELLSLAKQTGKYVASTEDANGNGELDVIPGGCGALPPRDCVEDGNGNGQIDKLYGISVTVNRRSERPLFVNDMGGGRSSRILVSGNDMIMGKMEYGSAPAP